MTATVTCQAALLTPPGRGAVASIGVQGSGCIEKLQRLLRLRSGKLLSQLITGRIALAQWGQADEIGEEVVICVRDAQRIELHCHGGKLASAMILDDLAAAGFAIVSGDEWLRGEHADPLAADAVAALTAAMTPRAASVLLDQVNGAWQRQLSAWRSMLDCGNAAQVQTEVQQCLKFAGLGTHLTNAWRVTLVGPANVGKSSLMNRMLGYERSIVFQQPGTTRDVIAARTAVDGWPIELSDTAGLREAVDVMELEQAGMQRTQHQLTLADLLLLVTEPGQWAASQSMLEKIAAAATPRPVLRVLNKRDLWSADAALPDNWWATCAITGEGVSELASAIAGRLVPDVPPPAAAVPFLPAHVMFLRRLDEELTRAEYDCARGRIEHIMLSGIQEGSGT